MSTSTQTISSDTNINMNINPDDRDDDDERLSIDKISIVPSTLTTSNNDNDEDALLPSLETSFVLQVSGPPLHATYSHLGTGEAIYEIETPRLKFLPPLTTIKRFTPDGPIIVAKLHRPGILPKSHYFEFPLQDNKKVMASAMFKKEGWSHYGHDRVFTLPNGKEVRWAMEVTKCKLYAKNPSKTVLVDFRAWKPKFLSSSSSAPTSPGSPASRKVTFQIFPQALFEGIEMEDAVSISRGSTRMNEEQMRVLDWVMATFVAVEGLRQARR
ncbi:hypothetical protein CPB83DRAFT_853370 [Crepidotus variabilis]|uniref:DUF6593 domain-containing protein n=1 Tax=Crepidotus variabilis TaxID=179855 RepID=A0A9P6EHA0_9AGAR|nr:hypothetical protein CPB83DRAFT_853370 [Crepidotus variabilis]